MSKITFCIKIYDDHKKGNGYVLTIIKNGFKQEVKKHFQVNQNKSDKAISLTAIVDAVSRTKEGSVILIKTNVEYIDKYVKKAIDRGWKLPIKLSPDLRLIAKLMDDVKTREITVIPWKERTLKTIQSQPIYSSHEEQN